MSARFIKAGLGALFCLGTATAAWAETTLIVPITSEPRTLSPAFAADTGGYHPGSNIYCHLVVMDWGVTQGVSSYGDLAKSWEMSEDAKTATFHLYEDAKWHDGEPVTSEDVQFTFETILEKKYPFAAYLSNVDRMETPDPHTLVVHLKEPDSPFVAMQAQAAAWTGKIYPKHIWENEEGFDSGAHVNEPIGCGPFRFKEWVRGSHVELVANEDYFRGPPRVDRLLFRFISDANVARAAFEAGEFPYLPYDYAPPLAELPTFEADPNIEVILADSHYGRDIYLNTKREPLSDLTVRQAISYAVDREEMNKLAFAGIWRPAYHAIVNSQDKWLNEEARFPDYDPAKAEELLDEAGYPKNDDGWRFKLSVTNPNFSDCKNMMEVLVQQLRRIGIDARWDQYDGSTWYDKAQKADFDITCYFVRYGPDPDAYREHFSTGGARNFSGYANLEFDRLANEARSLNDEAERRKRYQQMQALLVNDLPYINLFNVSQPSLIRDGWSGFNVQPSGFNKSITWFGHYAVTPPAN